MRSGLLPCFLAVAVTVSLIAACGNDSSEPNDPEGETTIPFRKDGTLAFLRDGDSLLTIAIEIADTDSARNRGMMQRAGFPEQSGMLFIFDREEPQRFWMANTPIGLDLMFVDADSQIVDIDKYARPLSPESITSDQSAQYVIEVPAGFADTHGIVETDRVRWQRDGSSAAP